MPPRRRRKRTAGNTANIDVSNSQSIQIKPHNHQKGALSSSALIPAADWRRAVILFFVALALYLSTGTVIPSNDTAANLFFPIQLFRGKLTYMPLDVPALYFWGKKSTSERIDLGVTIDSKVKGTALTGGPRTGRDFSFLRDLTMRGPKYMLSPTVRDKAECVNTFNLGTGITFVPVVAVLALFYPNLTALQENSWLLAYAGKVLASVLVAASASLVYLSAAAFPSVSRSDATLIASAYALGTCTWSVSSQALWQHGPNEFYLSVAIWALVKAQRRHEQIGEWSTPLGLLCGFAASMATISRPTSVVFAAAIGAYFLLAKRSIKMSLVYGVVGAVLGSAQLYYNYTYFGNPFEFGQQAASRTIAKWKTGSEDLWQTPLHVGAATLLVSPSRGLFVFSPFTVFALPAFYLAFKSNYSGKAIGLVRNQKERIIYPRGNEFEVVRPMCASVAILWCAAFKFFDHWGGYCFGYRPIVDTMPMVMMMLCVTMGHVQRNGWLRRIFYVTLACSVVVQFLGAFTYDSTWNYRTGEEFTAEGRPTEWAVLRSTEWSALTKAFPRNAKRVRIALDIDLPEYRSRLWSWRDSQIVYSVTNFQKCMKNRWEVIGHWIEYFG